MEAESLTQTIIGAAIVVHQALGPGLLESTYEACLVHELDLRGIKHERQLALPLVYKGMRLDCSYRLDLLVEKRVIVEIKSVSQIEPVFKAQLLTYLKLTGCKVGLLLNFNAPLLKDGICRLVNG